MTTLNLQVDYDVDDFRKVGTSIQICDVSVCPSLLDAGWFEATSDDAGSGMRFRNVTVPKAAVVTHAYLILNCSDVKTGTVVNTRVSAEDVDNAVAFDEDINILDRWNARTAARVNWDSIPEWAENTEYSSPDIKTVIQEIVNRAGWASGNALVIFWEDFESRSTEGSGVARRAHSHNNDNARAAKLQIVYDDPVNPAVTTQIVTSIGATTATGNGNATALGTPAATQHGHCWVDNSTWDGGSHPPTIADSKTENGVPGSTGAFTSNIINLTDENLYYARAYITSLAGTFYGGIAQFRAGGVSEGAFPSDAQTRVTSLTHRYDRGTYTLEILLGEVVSDFGLPEWSSKPRGAVPSEITAADEVREAIEREQTAISQPSPRISAPKVFAEEPLEPTAQLPYTELYAPTGTIPTGASAKVTPMLPMPSMPTSELMPIEEYKKLQQQKATQSLWGRITPWKEEEGETFVSAVTSAWKRLFG